MLPTPQQHGEQAKEDHFGDDEDGEEPAECGAVDLRGRVLAAQGANLGRQAAPVSALQLRANRARRNSLAAPAQHSGSDIGELDNARLTGGGTFEQARYVSGTVNYYQPQVRGRVVARRENNRRRACGQFRDDPAESLIIHPDRRRTDRRRTVRGRTGSGGRRDGA